MRWNSASFASSVRNRILKRSQASERSVDMSSIETYARIDSIAHIAMQPRIRVLNILVRRERIYRCIQRFPDD